MGIAKGVTITRPMFTSKAHPFAPFFLETALSDFDIAPESDPDRKIPVHSVVLSVVSEFFRRIIMKNTSNSNGLIKKVHVIRFTNYDILLDIVEFIYTGSVSLRCNDEENFYLALRMLNVHLDEETNAKVYSTIDNSNFGSIKDSSTVEVIPNSTATVPSITSERSRSVRPSSPSITLSVSSKSQNQSLSSQSHVNTVLQSVKPEVVECCDNPVPAQSMKQAVLKVVDSVDKNEFMEALAPEPGVSPIQDEVIVCDIPKKVTKTISLNKLAKERERNKQHQSNDILVVEPVNEEVIDYSNRDSRKSDTSIKQMKNEFCDGQVKKEDIKTEFTQPATNEASPSPSTFRIKAKNQLLSSSLLSSEDERSTSRPPSIAPSMRSTSVGGRGSATSKSTGDLVSIASSSTPIPKVPGAWKSSSGGLSQSELSLVQCQLRATVPTTRVVSKTPIVREEMVKSKSSTNGEWGDEKSSEVIQTTTIVKSNGDDKSQTLLLNECRISQMDVHHVQTSTPAACVSSGENERLAATCAAAISFTSSPNNGEQRSSSPILSKVKEQHDAHRNSRQSSGETEDDITINPHSTAKRSPRMTTVLPTSSGVQSMVRHVGYSSRNYFNKESFASRGEKSRRVVQTSTASALVTGDHIVNGDFLSNSRSDNNIESGRKEESSISSEKGGILSRKRDVFGFNVPPPPLSLTNNGEATSSSNGVSQDHALIDCVDVNEGWKISETSKFSLYWLKADVKQRFEGRELKERVLDFAVHDVYIHHDSVYLSFNTLNGANVSLNHLKNLDHFVTNVVKISQPPDFIKDRLCSKRLSTVYINEDGTHSASSEKSSTSPAPPASPCKNVDTAVASSDIQGGDEESESVMKLPLRIPTTLAANTPSPAVDATDNNVGGQSSSKSVPSDLPLNGKQVGLTNVELTNEKPLDQKSSIVENGSQKDVQQGGPSEKVSDGSSDSGMKVENTRKAKEYVNENIIGGGKLSPLSGRVLCFHLKNDLVGKEMLWYILKNGDSTVKDMEFKCFELLNRRVYIEPTNQGDRKTLIHFLTQYATLIHT